MLIFIFIFWIILCGAVAAWAHSKGLNGFEFFFVALVLSPLIGGIAVVCTKPNVESVAKRDGLRKCPQCAEYVKSEASVCRFCGCELSALQATAQPVPQEVSPISKTNPRVVIALVTLVLVGGTLLVLFSIYRK